MAIFIFIIVNCARIIWEFLYVLIKSNSSLSRTNFWEWQLATDVKNWLTYILVSPILSKWFMIFVEFLSKVELQLINRSLINTTNKPKCLNTRVVTHLKQSKQDLIQNRS